MYATVTRDFGRVGSVGWSKKETTAGSRSIASSTETGDVLGSREKTETEEKDRMYRPCVESTWQ